MIVDKPEWVRHSGEGGLTAIYGLDVHPDGSRFVTAGGDSKVKVWNMAPVLDAAQEADESVPKLLATLTSHLSAVNAVRFNGTGLLIASGSDDATVMVSQLRPGQRMVFGSTDVNHENWQASALKLSEASCNITKTRHFVFKSAYCAFFCPKATPHLLCRRYCRTAVTRHP